MKKVFFLVLCAVLFCTSCQKNVYYNEIKSVDKEKWNIKKPLTFSVDIKDSMAYYNMYIVLRNTTAFETQNFYVFMKTKYPDGYTMQDTLGFIVCDKFGNWTGKGQGRIKDNKFLFQPKVRFPRAGKYTFTVYQGMRTENVRGISDFGIVLENFKQD